MPQYPRVVIITQGYREIEQDYQNIEHIILEDIAPPNAFNDGIKSSNGDIYCVMTENETFVRDNVVTQAVNIFCKHPEFAVVYGDCLSNGTRTHYPSHVFTNFQRQDLIINTPFFFKQIDEEFNTNLEYLYYYDMLKRLSTKYIFHHIPEPLFEIVAINKNYVKDLSIINVQSN